MKEAPKWEEDEENDNGKKERNTKKNYWPDQDERVSHPFSKSEWRAIQRVPLSYPISPLWREQQLLLLTAGPITMHVHIRFTRRRRCSAQGTFVHKRSWLYERELACHLPDTQSALAFPPPLFFYVIPVVFQSWTSDSRTSCFSTGVTVNSFCSGRTGWKIEFEILRFRPSPSSYESASVDCQLQVFRFDMKLCTSVFVSGAFNCWKTLFLCEFVMLYGLDSIRSWIFANLFVWNTL